MKNKSYFRKLYIKRLIIRIIILLVSIGVYIVNPSTFNVVKDFNMIKEFSILDIIWLIFMIDMILQLCKVPKYWPLGSQKYFKERYKADLLKPTKNHFKEAIKKMNSSAVSVAITWILFITLIDTLYIFKIIPYEIIILISITFYVCDIICIVGWCPFKTFFMHNKCCTTCRIFNWDHAMMFSPLIVIPGLWTYSLLGLSLIIVIVWEITCIKHPERFIERTNRALRCRNCTDKICGRRV